MRQLKIFALFVSLTTVSLAFAETLKSLPEPTGPYQIGISKYDLTDPYRKELEYPKGRLIPIQIYFPIQKGKAPSASQNIRRTCSRKVETAKCRSLWPKVGLVFVN